MQEILEAVAAWIEEQIRDRRFRWMIAIPSAITTLLTIILTFAHVTPWDQIASVVNIAVLAISVIVLALSRRSMRNELTLARTALDAYGDQVKLRQENDPNLFFTRSWDEKIHIGPKGDTEIVRTFGLEVGTSSLLALWTLASRNSSNHLSAAIRRRVKIHASWINADDTTGTEIDTFKQWEGGTNLRIYLYFRDEIAPGTAVRVRLRITWPKYAADMVEERVEENSWIFRRATDNFTSVVTIDRSVAPRGVRISPVGGTPMPLVTNNTEGGPVQINMSISPTVLDQKYAYQVELART